jgi:hypothetical protein
MQEEEEGRQMAYKRKTRDVWNVQQYTGSQYGWETVSAGETFRDAREDAKAYRENQPEYPVRIRLGREPLEHVTQ